MITTEEYEKTKELVKRLISGISNSEYPIDSKVSDFLDIIKVYDREELFAEYAIVCEDPYSFCLPISLMTKRAFLEIGGEIQPHILALKLWRWPDLDYNDIIKPVYFCTHSSLNKEPRDCVNPNHYVDVSHNDGHLHLVDKPKSIHFESEEDSRMWANIIRDYEHYPNLIAYVADNLLVNGERISDLYDHENRITVDEKFKPRDNLLSVPLPNGVHMMMTDDSDRSFAIHSEAELHDEYADIVASAEVSIYSTMERFLNMIDIVISKDKNTDVEHFRKLVNRVINKNNDFSTSDMEISIEYDSSGDSGIESPHTSPQLEE